MTDFDRVCSYESLLRAHEQCRKGKRWKDSVAYFNVRALEYLDKLQASLQRGTYRVSRYHVFGIAERGKARTIKATRYADRIVLRSLCDNVLTPRVAKTFIAGNGASQKGKGTDYMRLRLQADMQSYVNKHGPDGFILVGDFTKFFDSIPHDYLDRTYSRYIEDERVLALLAHVHATIPGGKGLPLGNQTSQIGALLAGSGIDHFIKERLHIKYYGRYMDDFYLIHEDRQYLEWCLQTIQQLAADIGLQLNNRKTHILSLRSGITFLGFRFFVSRTGKVVIKAAKGKASRERRRLKKLFAKLDACEITYDDVREHYETWRAGLAPRRPKKGKQVFRPNTYYLLCQMDAYFLNLFHDFMPDADRAEYTARSAHMKGKVNV